MENGVNHHAVPPTPPPLTTSTPAVRHTLQQDSCIIIEEGNYSPTAHHQPAPPTTSRSQNDSDDDEWSTELQVVLGLRSTPHTTTQTEKENTTVKSTSSQFKTVKPSTPPSISAIRSQQEHKESSTSSPKSLATPLPPTTSAIMIEVDGDDFPDVNKNARSGERERDTRPLLAGEGSSKRSSSAHKHANIYDTNNAPRQHLPANETRFQEFKRRLWGDGKYTLGVILIVIVAIIWVAASVWIQYIFGDFNYNKPYFLTYFNTCGFGGWNLGFIFSQSWRDVPREPEGGVSGDIALDAEEEEGDETIANDTNNEHNDNDHHIPKVGKEREGGARQSSSVGSSAAPPSPTTSIPPNTIAYGGVDGDGSTCPKSEIRTHHRLYSLRRLAKSALLFCPLWFGANCLFNYSLSTTSVASNTILSTTSSIWTMIFSYFLLGQPIFRIHKIAAVMLCIGGSVLVALSDNTGGSGGDGGAIINGTTSTSNTHQASTSSSTRTLVYRSLQQQQQHIASYSNAFTNRSTDMLMQPQGGRDIVQGGMSPPTSTIVAATTTTIGAHPYNSGGHPQYNHDGPPPPAMSDSTRTIIGDLLALLSAVFYGAYTTTLKWCLPNESRYYMGMVFGFVGVWNMVLMWPGLMIIDATGIEPFELPPTWFVLGALAINAAVGTNLSDVLWAKSVVLTSPLVATLGLSMTIPVALVYDLVIRGEPFSGMYLGGAGLVVLGFVVSNLRSS